MFFAALRSLSWTAPHVVQVHWRTFSDSGPLLMPHGEHGLRERFGDDRDPHTHTVRYQPIVTSQSP
jgi:hypothetical protein